MSTGVQNYRRGIVHAEGEIDLSNAKELRDAMESEAGRSPEGLIVDLTDVTYIDSAGIQAIIAVYQRVIPGGGKIVLLITNPNLRQIFALIHPEKLPGFHLCDSVESAERLVFAA